MVTNPIVYGQFARTLHEANLITIILTKAMSSETYLTLHKAGVDYVVPSGKVFRALKVIFVNGDTTNTKAFFFFSATAADSATGKVEIIEDFRLGAKSISALDCNIDFVAGKYVNAWVEGANTSITIMGIELDA